MPEFRQNRATKEWIIIASERAKRPQEFIESRSKPKKLPPFDPDCPFCPGNEDKTPIEVFSLRKGRSKKWQARVIPNKYPALVPEGQLLMQTEGFFLRAKGIGYHEVIIHTPQHNKDLAHMSLPQVEKICLTYRRRYLDLQKDKRIKMIIIFENHGKRAGTSLEHPHSQLVALPLVPASIRHLLEEAMRYYDDHGSCVFCDMIQEELKAEKRIIAKRDDFVAFHPFASRAPFETWILPLKHNASFGSIKVKECKNMAKILKEILGKLDKGLSDPSYNLLIRTVPIKDREEDYYHWHIQILPRLTTPAGFELGSGIYINAAFPESTADFLKNKGIK
ncbi:MAG: galactose-1-phosphate uridylyltransferase [Candidatus Zixiibacteriota bacterium]